MNIQTWLWLLKSMAPYKRRIAALIGSAAALGLAHALVPLLLQRLVDDALTATLNLSVLLPLIGCLLIGAAPLTYIHRDKLRNAYRYHMRGEVLQHLLSMGQGFYDERGSTRVITEVTKGVDAARNLITKLCHGHFLVHLPVAVFATFYVASLSVGAAACLLGFFVLFITVSKMLGQRMSMAEREFHKIDNGLAHRHREAIHYVGMLKLHNATRSELTHYWREGKRALALRNTLTYLYMAPWAISQSSNSIACLVVLWFFLPELLSGDISAGTFFALVLYATRVIQPAAFLGDLYAEIKRESAMLEPVITLLAEKPSIVEAAQATTLGPLQSVIALDDVSFKYPGCEEPALHGVTLEIPVGQKTAIVGPSGAGKTTLTKLLVRLYDPDSGAVHYDNVDLRQVCSTSLYEQITCVSQDVPIFTGTIRDNVTLGVDGYTDHDIWEALKCASADGFVEEKGGLETMIGESGRKLSGGERQRIALARLILRNSPVVVLDEATSALDNVTEDSVNDTFAELAGLNGSKTIVVVAHRLSTVRNADRIVVMDNGQIIDIGNHDELLKRCTLYKKLNEPRAAANLR